MIQWTVEAAIESQLFETVLVSTDDDEIAACAALPGATIHRRPARLAADNVPLSQVLAHLLQTSDNKPDAVCLMMPNCPLRNSTDIRASFESFRTADASATMSVVSFDWRRPEWALAQADGYLRAASGQDLRAVGQRDSLLCPSGALRWVDPEIFLSAPTFYPDRLTGYEMPWHRAIDIDESADLELANCVAHAIDSGFRFAAGN